MRIRGVNSQIGFGGVGENLEPSNDNQDRTSYTIQNPNGNFQSMGIELFIGEGKFVKEVGKTNGILTLGNTEYTIEIDIESSGRINLKTHSKTGTIFSTTKDIKEDIIFLLEKSIENIINFLKEKDGVNSKILRIVREQ